ISRDRKRWKNCQASVTRLGDLSSGKLAHKLPEQVGGGAGMTLHSSRLTIFKIMAQRWKAIMERLVAATASPGQDRRVVILILITYTTVWTAYAIIAKSTQGIHPDMAEVFSWSWDLDWGTHKHPPLLPALVSLWFSVFPVSDWAYYLLAVILTAVAIYFTWLL